jgi:hypothetical protein
VAGAATSNADNGRRLRRESDRDIVPMKPGNSGGGKAPDFWYAFDDREDRVIGVSLETPERSGSFRGSSIAWRRPSLGPLPCKTLAGDKQPWVMR